jgi:hypothetical protein
MTEKQIIQRSPFDRRTGFDRRKLLSADYCEGSAIEKRKSMERRWISKEKRSGWERDTQWSSVSVKNRDAHAPVEREGIQFLY